MPTAALRSAHGSGERLFYSGMTVAVLAALLLGFSRTFFLRSWFPEAAAHSAPEPFFFLHGIFFAAWFVWLLVQARLIAARRIQTHRTLGWVGAGLAAFMVVLGVIGALLAARRPTGFVGVPVPPLQFLTVPLADIALFALFVVLAIVKRRDAQSHKRCMLLATISIVEAAVARWPFAIMASAPLLPFFGATELFTDLFLVPMVVWDLVSRRRLHPVTVWGGLALLASQPFRFWLSETDAWLAFAGWLVGLLG